MIVGRVLPSARTTDSAIESTAKGATGPEGAVETTGAGDKRGMSSERSPADKLLLVERGGFGMMYDRTPTSDERVRGDHEKEVKNEPTNTTRARKKKKKKKPRAMKDEILWPRERIGEHTTVQGRKSDE